MLIVLVIGFLVGVLVILAAETLGVYFIIKWLNQKTQRNETKLALQSEESFRELDPNQSLYFAYNKQGIVWFLESEKAPRNFLENAPNEQKKKKKFLEVSPVKKQAQIKDQKLLLTESDGSRTAIELKGCVVEAVSASSTSSRKWAKRFPIKLESKTSILYKGSKTLYIYLETSWEKESWCKALRLASSDQKERFDWFSKLQEEFHSYLTTLNAGYPLFMKPSTGYSSDSGDHKNKPEGTSSKFRLLLKKIAKKTARVGLENKSSFSSLSGRAERRASEKTRPIQETISETGSPKAAPSVKRSKSEENMDQQSLSTFSSCGSQSHISVTPDADPDDKFGNDEGTLCWNLLISRLFFDVKGNEEIKRSIQSRVQRTLSSTRTPSYIGEVICTGIELGNLPPYVHAMRILPMDINEAWAFEVDIEYSGGAVLHIETRLEVRELDFQKSTDSDQGSNSVDISSDLLEGFEVFGKQLMSPTEETVDESEWKEEDELKSSKNAIPPSTTGSRWKSILNSIAKQVSQVPLSLAVRVTSLRGTLRLHIKPPPSDQLWFAFTSMPDIDFNLESAVGEHRITNGHIALLLVSRLKAAIRDAVVLPNCGSLCLPWMIAERDDWVPKKVAPFGWVNQETISDPTVREAIISQPNGAKTKTESNSSSKTKTESNSGAKTKTESTSGAKTKTESTRETSSDIESKYQKSKNSESINESSDASPTSMRAASGSGTLQELRTPLLGSDEPQETCKQVEEVLDSQSPSRSAISIERRHSTTTEDDSRLKRLGRRAKMLDLGKKMGEKFEEKRRHIEEKSRHFVEKMRGP